MLTNASKYAIRATLFLASNSKDGFKHSAVNIALALDISPAFIAKLLQQLAREDIISSTKGPKGGFFISKSNGKLPVMSIIELIDGENVFDSCYLGLPNCSHDKPCPVHHIFHPFRLNILQQFQHKTISELADEVDQKGMYLSLRS